MKKFPTDSVPGWGAPARYVATLAVVALAYFVLAKLGLKLASINPSASPIWPPSGIALAAVLLGGPRLWPAIFIGAFIANATNAGTLTTSVFIAAGNTLEALIGGALIQRWSGGRDTFATPVQVAKFVVIGVGPATVTSASIGVLTLCLAGLAPWQSFPPIWITWWLGDAAGILTVTPVLVLWAQTDWRSFYKRELRETAAVLLCAVAVGLIGFNPLLPPSEYTSPLGFLAILPVLWAALRRGPRDTSTVGLVLGVFAIWATIRHAGPFGQMGMNEAFLLLLTFMISVSVPSLALSADVAVRRANEESLRQIRAELDERVRERTAALADANTHLREAQRLANLGSWSWDVAQNRIDWSDELYAIYGRTPGQFHGTFEEFIGFVHPEDRAPLQATLADALKSGQDFTHDERITRPDGSVRYLQSIAQVVRDEQGNAIRVLGVCLDVTERKQAESALHDSEQSTRLLLEGVRDHAIYLLDTEGRVRTWNDAAARIKGYRAEDVIGRHFRHFYTEEDRAQGEPERSLAVAEAEGKYEAQGWRIRKDGSRFFANTVVSTIRNEAGELIGFAKITRDITAQHEAQIALEETREQLAQSQKMEALGQLTGGIAHDFNNLLMIVSGYAQILQRRLNDAKDKQAVEAIRAAASRGEKLTRQLLTFSRRQQLTPVVVDLRARIGAVRDMLVPSLSGNIKFVSDIPDDIWPVKVDQGELELALVNIAVNARDAMPEGGSITLSARNVSLKQGAAAGALSGEFVALAIADTGSGMPPETVSRVFEPFFTTKPVGKGTGLGLSQVHGFAAQSGGAVTVASEVGRGTVVTVYLPRGRGAAATESGETASPAKAQAQGMVLLVEDSREVADVATAMLDQLGYRVERAEDTAEALRRLQQGSAFDLLLSDIVMPGSVDGIGLAEICRERYPEIPILLMSGFSDATQSADGRFDILRKPFDLATLERAIELSVGNVRARAQRRAALR